MRDKYGSDAVEFVPGASPSDTRVDEGAIQQALAAAARADVIVIVLGDSGEGRSKALPTIHVIVGDKTATDS